MKERLKKAAIAYLIAGVSGLAAAFVMKLIGFGIPCIFQLFTGYKCPGCGNTRAVLAYLSLDFKSGFEYNRLFPLEGAYILWVLAQYTILYVRTGRKELEPKPMALNIIVLVIILAWTVCRNIYGM